MSGSHSINIRDLNDKLEKGELTKQEIDPDLHNIWLWGLDPTEKISVKSLFNESQLLGLLVARIAAVFSNKQEATTLKDHFEQSCLVINDRCVSEMTQREFSDSMDNLQLQWKKAIGGEELEKCMDAVRCLFIRFGKLIMKPYPASVLDNPNETRETQGGMAVSHAFVRKYVDLFLVLFRTLELLRCCTLLPGIEDGEKENEELQEFHKSASMEDFYNMSMHYDLCPGQRVQYMHEFSGMYNSITQVVYFHQPSYERQRQLSLEELQTGKFPINTLPLILQMYPEVSLIHEDDPFPTAPTQAPEDEDPALQNEIGTWKWVLCAAMVYLYSPSGRVYYSDNINVLLDKYLTCTQGKNA